MTSFEVTLSNAFVVPSGFEWCQMMQVTEKVTSFKGGTFWGWLRKVTFFDTEQVFFLGVCFCFREVRSVCHFVTGGDGMRHWNKCSGVAWVPWGVW